MLDRIYGAPCPLADTLIVVGAVPLCRVDSLDPVLLALLADCVGANGPSAPEGPPCFFVHAVTCEEARAIMEEARYANR